jgi:predicted metal-dependent HD superfamily phosphohydrolase
MNPSSTVLLEAAELKACVIIETKTGDNYHFHNLQHTQQVVNACEEIAGHYQLNDEDRLALLVAAWFHDTGYSSGQANHENSGIELAKEFLALQHAEESLVNKVSACIAATKMPQRPTNLLEEIICDADLYHLGTEMVAEAGKALRQEINLTKNVHISKTEWARTNIYFMEQHHYFTDYCREKLEPVKQEYIRKLRKKYGLQNEVIVLPEKIANYGAQKIQQQQAGKNDATTAAGVGAAELPPKKEKQKEKPFRTLRGVETMLRTTSSNNFRLSSMADSKAHIMISVNSIIISIVASRLLEKLKNFPHFIIPAIILTLVCLGAIIFAVLATRPNISKGKFSREEIEAKKTNLLFFGNFYQMGIDEYEWAMKEMMKDGDYLYGSMIRDIYFLGIVLARKYKWLRISYNVFMFGLVISTIAFIVASFFAPAQ